MGLSDWCFHLGIEEGAEEQDFRILFTTGNESLGKSLHHSVPMWFLLKNEGNDAATAYLMWM